MFVKTICERHEKYFYVPQNKIPVIKKTTSGEFIVIIEDVPKEAFRIIRSECTLCMLLKNQELSTILPSSERREL